MRRTIVREQTPRQVLRSQAAALDLTQRDILARLKGAPFHLAVNLDKVNHLMTGRLDLARAAVRSPHVLAGLMIVLEIRELDELGLSPEQAPIVHLILEGYRSKGLPPTPPGGGEREITHTYPTSRLLVTGRAA